MNYTEETYIQKTLYQLTRIADSLEKISSHMGSSTNSTTIVNNVEKSKEPKTAKNPEKIEPHYVVAARYDTSTDASIALAKLHSILTSMGIPAYRYPYIMELMTNQIRTNYGDIWFLANDGRPIRDGFRVDQAFGFPIGMQVILNKSGNPTECDDANWETSFFDYVIEQELIRLSRFQRNK